MDIHNYDSDDEIDNHPRIERRSSIEDNNRQVQQNASSYVINFAIKKYILLCNIIDFSFIIANIIVMGINSNFVNNHRYHVIIVYLYLRTGMLCINTPISLYKYFKTQDENDIENRYVYNALMNCMLVTGTLIHILGFVAMSYANEELSKDLYNIALSNLIVATIIYLFPVLIMCCVACCIPCIIIMEVMRELDISDAGATDEELNNLTDYIFDLNSNEVVSEDKKNRKQINPTNESDITCCICLAQYNNKDKLRLLSCDHHFHKECCDKWLKINKTCPLCRQSITNEIDNSYTSLIDV
jgi:hypothetical protein